MTLNSDVGSYQHKYSEIFYVPAFLIFQCKGFVVLVSFFLGNEFNLYSLLSAVFWDFLKKTKKDYAFRDHIVTFRKAFS